MSKDGAKGEGKIFGDEDEAKLAYANGNIELGSNVKVRMKKEIDGKIKTKIIDTTVGRLIFNEAIPQDLGFVDRSDEKTMFEPEINFRVNKSKLQQIVDATFKLKGATMTCIILDAIKAMGFKYSTIGAITTSIFDMHIPSQKKDILAEAQENVIKFEQLYNEGVMTQTERHYRIVKVWEEAVKKVQAL